MSLSCFSHDDAHNILASYFHANKFDIWLVKMCGTSRVIDAGCRTRVEKDIGGLLFQNILVKLPHHKDLINCLVVLSKKNIKHPL